MCVSEKKIEKKCYKGTFGLIERQAYKTFYSELTRVSEKRGFWF